MGDKSEAENLNDDNNLNIEKTDNTNEKLLAREDSKQDQDVEKCNGNLERENSLSTTQKVLTAIPRYSKSFYKQNSKLIKRLFCALLVVLYVIYLIFALVYDANKAQPVLILTAVVLVIVLLEICIPKLRKRLSNRTKDHGKGNSSATKNQIQKFIPILWILAAIALSAWIIIDVFMRNPSQIISLFGLMLIVFVGVICSKYPAHINWRPVIWGIGMQFILGLLILRTSAGYNSVKFVGDQVAVFMTYSDDGAQFVFGKESYLLHFFAFKILPMIVFFSTVMNMLYYIGIMQWFIGKLAWITEITLGTSAIESTVAVANIFVGMTEAPLVVRPYLKDLTNAEIHSVLTCGLGSIAFSVFGPFVGFGIDSVHLLTACVMSAPAGLVISRLLYPERKVSKFITTSSLKMSGRPERNIVEAAAAGASMSIGLVANIAANLIAFLALLAFINATLSWFGSFVGHENISFQNICGYLFMPLAFMMGADWEDCALVGEFFGIKSFLNEFIAYKSMKPYIAARLEGGEKFINGKQMYMSELSEVITIHALCGFCNVSSLGIIVGGLSVLMPSRQQDLAQLAVRALFGGALTCCMTASIAGLLFVPTASEVITSSIALANTTLNSTIVT